MKDDLITSKPFFSLVLHIVCTSEPSRVTLKPKRTFTHGCPMADMILEQDSCMHSHTTQAITVHIKIS